MDKNEEIKIDTVKMGTIRRFSSKFNMYPDDVEISFEVIMTAFFPAAYYRIQKYASDCYTKGYIEGKKAAEEKE